MSDDLDLIIAAAREAGAMALEFSRGGFRTWEKSPGNPVTDADVAIDNFLSRKLRDARPGYGWLSEEQRDDRSWLSAHRSFIVDPVDGTRDYARGRDGYAVSIAIVQAGQVIAAALFAPARDALYIAERDGGATLNGRALSVSGATRMDALRLAVDPSVLRARIWDRPWTATTTEKPNAMALRIAMVARGDADAVFDGRRSRYLDIAAATLILTEAGGMISDHDNRPPRFDREPAYMTSLVASTPALHAQLCARVGEGLRRYADHQARAAKRGA